MKPVTITGIKFIGGRLCLDFVNTVGGRSGNAVLRDKLASYEDLMRWSRLAGLPPARAARSGGAVLRRAIALREALFRIFTGKRPRAADLNIFQRELSMARSHERLTATFEWAWDRPEAADRVLWEVVRSAAELLTSRDREKIRRCAGEECGWLFLDTSRNHSRQWCDMRDCGNRAKVRRFRERSR
jgi:predicted RNA-binding Zn ribbon-like protein